MINLILIIILLIICLLITLASYIKAIEMRDRYFIEALKLGAALENITKKEVRVWESVNINYNNTLKRFAGQFWQKVVQLAMTPVGQIWNTIVKR